MTSALTPLFVGGLPGGTEMMVILLIAVLLFGANKIPKLARSTGQAMGEFRRGKEEIEQELEEMQEEASDAVSPSTSGEMESTEGESTEDSSEGSGDASDSN